MLTFPADMTVSQKQAFEKRYRQAAASYFPMRVAYYHQFTGGTYSRITIRGQHTRWGSCSPQKRRITLSTRLIHLPLLAIQGVVIHEYAHLAVPNHSARFYDLVRQLMPTYPAAAALLKGG